MMLPSYTTCDVHRDNQVHTLLDLLRSCNYVGSDSLNMETSDSDKKQEVRRQRGGAGPRTPPSDSAARRDAGTIAPPLFRE